LKCRSVATRYSLPLCVVLLGVGGVAEHIAAGASSDGQPGSGDDCRWYDVRQWGIEGKGWNETESYFDRLPAEAKDVVRPVVWNLSHDSAGMLTRFETDSTTIRIRYRLTSERLAMAHMPATGVSGVDLYARNENGQWHWLATTKPTAQNVDVTLVAHLAPGKRAYTLYLPLYNGVETLEIGVTPDASFEPIAPRADRPIVFYGTSITQGGCASRPGMAYPALIGRRLDRPVINLGFSGNGTMEAELGELLAELDAAVYVIDCLPNMNAEMVAERAEPLVRRLRRARPDTPIVLVEDRAFANTPFLPEKQAHHAANRAALAAAYERLTDSGVTGLSYIKGDTLLGDDGEATVDGSHPTDLGMQRYAEALMPALREVLNDSTQP
jgi:lysophospholipase L1-like esterase